MKHRLLYVLVAALVAAGGGAVVALAGGGHACNEAIDETAAKISAKGWLGIDTAKDESTGAWRVTAVAAGSPAADAGFQTGDVLVALNGVALTAANKEAVYKAKAQLGVGKAVTYTVERAGAERTLTATLVEVPRDVLAKWVGEHVLEYHAKVEVAAKN